MNSRSFLVRAGLISGGVLLFVLLTVFTLRMAVPNVVGSGQRAAESSAVSQLRTLLWAQDRYRENLFADRDGDQKGEYAFLAELSNNAEGPGGVDLNIPLLEGPLGQVTAARVGGVAVLGPYVYRVYLPAAGGGGAGERPEGGEVAGQVDPDGAERHWVAYAWPVKRGQSGFKVFYINQDEEIWQSDNSAPGQQYNGLEHGPAFDAALSRPDLSAIPSDTQPGGDGGRWVRWKGKQPRSSAGRTP